MGRLVFCIYLFELATHRISSKSFTGFYYSAAFYFTTPPTCLHDPADDEIVLQAQSTVQIRDIQ